MTTALHVSFAQGVTPRQLKSRSSRLVAAKQRLVVRATAGDDGLINLVFKYINKSVEDRSYVAPSPAFANLFPSVGCRDRTC